VVAQARAEFSVSVLKDKPVTAARARRIYSTTPVDDGGIRLPVPLVAVSVPANPPDRDISAMQATYDCVTLFWGR
jgi:hypothetical protein